MELENAGLRIKGLKFSIELESLEIIPEKDDNETKRYKLEIDEEGLKNDTRIIGTKEGGIVTTLSLLKDAILEYVKIVSDID